MKSVSASLPSPATPDDSCTTLNFKQTNNHDREEEAAGVYVLSAVACTTEAHKNAARRHLGHTEVPQTVS